MARRYGYGRGPGIVPGGTTVDPFRLVAAHNAARQARGTQAMKSAADLAGGRLESATDVAGNYADILKQTLASGKDLAGVVGGTNLVGMLNPQLQRFGTMVPDVGYSAQQDVLRQDTQRAGIESDLAKAAEARAEAGQRADNQFLMETISAAPPISEEVPLADVVAAGRSGTSGTKPKVRFQVYTTVNGTPGVVTVEADTPQRARQMAEEAGHRVVGVEEGTADVQTSPTATGTTTEQGARIREGLTAQITRADPGATIVNTLEDDQGNVTLVVRGSDNNIRMWRSNAQGDYQVISGE